MKGPSIFWFERSELRPLFAQLTGPAAPAAPARRPRREDVGELTEIHDSRSLPLTPRVPSLQPSGPLPEPPPESAQGPLLTRQARALTALLRSANLAHNDFNALTSDVAAAAVEGLGVERASVWLYEAASGWLKGVASYQRSTSRHEIPGYLPAEQFPNFFAALASRMPLAADDASDDPRTVELVVRHVVDPELRSFLAVPILQGDYLSGVLCIEHISDRRIWNSDDEAFASALVSFLGVALASFEHRRLAAEHAMVEHRLRLQNQAISGLSRGQLIGQEDAGPALREMTRSVSVTLGCERASVWLLNDDRDAIRSLDLYRRHEDAHEGGAELKAEQFPAYFEALRSERAIAAHDALGDPRTREFGDSYLRPLGIGAMLDVPIRVGERMIGVLCCEHVGPARTWSVDEEQFAAAVSDMIALAIESAERRRADRERGEREARQRSFQGALLRLARSEKISKGLVEEAIREVTSLAASSLGVGRASVWLLDPEHTAIHCLDLFKKLEDTHEGGLELRAEQFPGYFEALRAERTIAAHDALEDPRTREFGDSYLRPLGIGAMLDVPIRVGERMIGVLCCEHLGLARTWSVDEEQMAASLSDFVALAMEASQRHQAEAELEQALIAGSDVPVMG